MFGVTPRELADRFTVSDLIEQVAYDLLEVEAADEI